MIFRKYGATFMDIDSYDSPAGGGQRRPRKQPETLGEEPERKRPRVPAAPLSASPSPSGSGPAAAQMWVRC